MGHALRLHDGTGILLQGPSGIVMATGPTVPSSGAMGYQYGAMFLQDDGSTESTSLYINTGTAASCTFTAFDYNFTAMADLLDDLTATATEINRAADTSERIVNCTASTLAVTEALHDGKIITLNRAAGIAVTLPAASAGLWFRFIVGTTFTGAASIKSVSGADVMVGGAILSNDSDNAIVRWPALAASTLDTIDLFGTANSTGGIAGQVIEIIGLAANLWWVDIRGDAAGTEASPFADSVA